MQSTLAQPLVTASRLSKNISRKPRFQRHRSQVEGAANPQLGAESGPNVSYWSKWHHWQFGQERFCVSRLCRGPCITSRSCAHLSQLSLTKTSPAQHFPTCTSGSFSAVMGTAGTWWEAAQPAGELHQRRCRGLSIHKALVHVQRARRPSPGFVSSSAASKVIFLRDTDTLISQNEVQLAITAQ